MQFNKEQLSHLYLDKHLSGNQIATMLRVSPPMVYVALKEFGIPLHYGLKYRLTKEYYEKLYCEEGLSLADIAEGLGCGVPTVSNWLRRYGITTRSLPLAQKLRHLKNKPKHIKHQHSKELYEKLYWQERLSITAIAKVLGCSTARVHFWLKRYNIPIRNRASACRTKPSGAERRFMEICERYNLPFAYVGDGKLIIDGFNPDFVNTNGKKQLIEIFGNYWHRDPFDRRKSEWGRSYHYAKFGFKTLIIWENELRDERKVVKKIKQLSREKMLGVL